MFKKIQNRVADFVERMRNPAEASRTIFAAMLIVGLLGLTSNFGEIIAAEKLQSRILLAAETSAAAEKEETIPVLETAQKCANTRKSGDAAKLIAQFEKSFAGILPGISQFLNKEVVVTRKELLVRETMGRFAEMKYCIPRENIDGLVDENYDSVIDFLSPYTQVFLNEDDPDANPLDEVNKPFTTDYLKKVANAQTDLRTTEKLLRNKIEAAINSALALDRHTQEQVASLVGKTSNAAQLDTNATLNTLSKINNQIAIINSAISGSVKTTGKIGAVDETMMMPVLEGGTYTTVPMMKTVEDLKGTALGYVPIDTAIKYSKQEGIDGIAAIEVAGDESLANLGISFGLFNLFEIAQLPAIMEQVGLETSIYLGTLFQVDPLTPGAEDTFSTAANKIYAKMFLANEDQFCAADEKCFGFE